MDPFSSGGARFRNSRRDLILQITNQIESNHSKNAHDREFRNRAPPDEKGSPIAVSYREFGICTSLENLSDFRLRVFPLAKPNPSDLFYGFAEPIFEPISETFLLSRPARGNLVGPKG